MKLIKTISLILPLLYIGCGESGNKNSGEEILGQLGLDIQKQKISIDFNKTTTFIKKMEIEMHGKADELQHKIKKADINFTRDMGIDFSDEKLTIDLNKTKKMFQEINILMKEVLQGGNSSKY